MHNFNHFFYFYVTAQFGSITKASDYLKISQPSLSAQIKTLEENLDFALFVRNGRAIELTAKGKVFYRYCSKMFQDLEGVNKFLNAKDENEIENLKIAVSDQVERPFVAEVIGKFIKKYNPDNLPRIVLYTDSHENLLGPFKLGEYDLLITHSSKSLNRSSVSVMNLPVTLTGTVKILFKNGKSFKNLNSFFKSNNVGLILPTETFKLREETENFLLKEKCQAEVVFESNILASNIRVVMEGAGLAFIPQAYIKKELKKGTLASFSPPNGHWIHQLYMATQPSKESKKGIEEFKTLFLEEVNID